METQKKKEEDSSGSSDDVTGAAVGASPPPPNTAPTKAAFVVCDASMVGPSPPPPALPTAVVVLSGVGGPTVVGASSAMPLPAAATATAMEAAPHATPSAVFRVEKLVLADDIYPLLPSGTIASGAAAPLAVHYVYSGEAKRRFASTSSPQSGPLTELVPHGQGTLELFVVKKKKEGGTVAGSAGSSGTSSPLRGRPSAGTTAVDDDGGAAAAGEDLAVAFVGAFVDGKKNGFGELLVPQRYSFCCLWAEDVPQLSTECHFHELTKGTIFSGMLCMISDGQSAVTRSNYAGLAWAANVRFLPDATGEMIYSDRSRYCGQWQCGQRQGFGISIEPQTNQRFVGAFEDDARHGAGTLFRDTLGTAYCGTWTDGVISGGGGLYLKSHATVQGLGWNSAVTECREATILKSRNVNGMWEPLFVDFDNELATMVASGSAPAAPTAGNNGARGGPSPPAAGKEESLLESLARLTRREDFTALLATFQRCFYFMYGSCGSSREYGGGGGLPGEIPAGVRLVSWCSCVGMAAQCQHRTRGKPISTAVLRRALEDMASFVFSVRLRLQSFVVSHPRGFDVDVSRSVLRMTWECAHRLVFPVLYNLCGVAFAEDDGLLFAAFHRCRSLGLADFACHIGFLVVETELRQRQQQREEEAAAEALRRTPPPSRASVPPLRVIPYVSSGSDIEAEPPGGVAGGRPNSRQSTDTFVDVAEGRLPTAAFHQHSSSSSDKVRALEDLLRQRALPLLAEFCDDGADDDVRAAAADGTVERLPGLSGVLLGFPRHHAQASLERQLTALRSCMALVAGACGAATDAPPPPARPSSPPLTPLLPPAAAKQKKAEPPPPPPLVDRPCASNDTVPSRGGAATTGCVDVGPDSPVGTELGRFVPIVPVFPTAAAQSTFFRCLVYLVHLCDCAALLSRLAYLRLILHECAPAYPPACDNDATAGWTNDAAAGASISGNAADSGDSSDNIDAYCVTQFAAAAHTLAATYPALRDCTALCDRSAIVVRAPTPQQLAGLPVLPLCEILDQCRWVLGAGLFARPDFYGTAAGALASGIVTPRALSPADSYTASPTFARYRSRSAATASHVSVEEADYTDADGNVLTPFVLWLLQTVEQYLHYHSVFHPSSASALGQSGAGHGQTGGGFGFLGDASPRSPPMAGAQCTTSPAGSPPSSLRVPTGLQSPRGKRRSTQPEVTSPSSEAGGLFPPPPPSPFALTLQYDAAAADTWARPRTQFALGEAMAVASAATASPARRVDGDRQKGDGGRELDKEKSASPEPTPTARAPLPGAASSVASEGSPAAPSDTTATRLNGQPPLHVDSLPHPNSPAAAAGAFAGDVLVEAQVGRVRQLLAACGLQLTTVEAPAAGGGGGEAGEASPMRGAANHTNSHGGGGLWAFNSPDNETAPTAAAAAAGGAVTAAAPGAHGAMGKQLLVSIASADPSRWLMPLFARKALAQQWTLSLNAVHHHVAHRKQTQGLGGPV